MKTRLILFIVLTCSILQSAKAQQTIYYQSISEELHQAKELYLKNKFIAAQDLFASIANKSEEGTETYSEARFYEALCALKLETDNSEELIQSYLDEYPESPYANRGWVELGNVLFNNKRYPQMLRAYRNIDTKSLTAEEKVTVGFQNGYANLQSENYAIAEREFARIKDSNHKLSPAAKYYWGHIQYINEEYDEALQVFEELQSNPAFQEVLPYYISQIYYMQGKYNQVVEYASPLYNNASTENKTALAKILGNSYFHLNQYNEAINYLEAYFKESNSKKKEENYMLGYCYYKTGKYEQAIPYLQIGSQGNDEMAQNAYYHLAGCYIQTGNKDQARVAFESAAAMDFNEDIKEDALFNFAKITYELSYSPFNETIKAFDEYISRYPDSGRNDDAYDYLVQVYMSTSNYKDAIESIEKIQVKSQSIKDAWQRVTFYRGLELLNNLDYNSAVSYFNQSLSNGGSDQGLKAAATFWKAESQYRMEDYPTAVSGFNQFLNMNGARTRSEYQMAHYNLAYGYFKLTNYSQAKSNFTQYISAHKNEQSDKLADAYNRLADCYFIERNYKEAITNYQLAYSLDSYDPDYALYQLALCYGLNRNQDEKINQLNIFRQKFSNSSLVDDANFELGRTYERTGNTQAAINQYEQLLKGNAQSTYLSKALLQLGLIYYNQSEFNKSLDYYKQITEDYPNSPEAQSALLGIRNNYVELNNVDAYFSYANQLGSGTQISVSEQDSLTYLSAERLVMNSDEQARPQLERYLQQYPSGSFSLNAHFYLGELKYTAGEYSSALTDYEYVTSKPDNIFTESALAKASELTYNSANYDTALEYFERLESASNTKWNLLKARAGIMRCYYIQANYKDCIDAAQLLLTSDKLTDELEREANYKLAKSYYLTDNSQQAQPIFGELAEDTNSEEGAEAKFMLIEILFSQDKLDDAENEVMDYISMNTPHQYWLAKSFITLADIYLRKGDQFQAKHTLKSLVENYPDSDDGITDTASAKLQGLEELEAQEQETPDTQLEIDINQQ